MRNSIFIFLSVLITFSCSQRQPNIVLIMTDDQGYGDLGCYGSATIATPNVDRLCAEGMKFESFYVHNRCSPTRAALMTGCHAHRVGVDNVVYRRERIGLHADEITIAELLQKAGYSTGMVGKWHLGEWDAFNPINHGFAFFFGFMESGEGKSTAIYRNKKIVERVKGKTDGVHSPKLLAAGIDFMRANKNRPFFLYYAHNYPHTPYQAGKDFKGTSQDGVRGDVMQELQYALGINSQPIVLDSGQIVVTGETGTDFALSGITVRETGASNPVLEGAFGFTQTQAATDAQVFTLATTVRVRTDGSVTTWKESSAETSTGRSGPPMPASSVARTNRSGPKARPRGAVRVPAGTKAPT